MIPHLNLQTLFAATEAEAAVGVVPTWVKLLLTIGVFVIPYGLGVLIARQLKLKEYALKISTVLVATSLGLMPFLYQNILGVYEQQHYEKRLAEWEAAQEDAVLQPEDILEIQEENKNLIIDTGKAGSTPKMSSVGE